VLANVPVFVEPLHFAAAVQGFSTGGYEVTVKLLDAQKIAEQRCRPQFRGPRLPKGEGESDPENVLRAQYRAKKRVRLLAKNMAADRILTLTTRETENTPEDMLRRWQRWLKLLDRASHGNFHYVAVLERHPSNPKHLHLHVAIAVFLNVNILRQCWWQVCGGRGMGNVHVKRLRSRSPANRVSRVAAYISKYITKDTIVQFNKKRYWASRIDLPTVRRYWLKGRTLLEAFGEAMQMLGAFPRNIDGFGWIREEKAVAWFSSDDMYALAPPF
jgi:hypothetical protein